MIFEKQIFIKHSILLLLDYIFTILLSPLQGISKSQPIYFDFTFHCSSFPFWEYPDGTFHHVHQRQLQYIHKKIQMKMQKMKLQ
jgi:hypothetical protein